MPRRGNVPKREVLPDPNYNSVLVTKLVNSIMLDGKKGVAQKVVYGAFCHCRGEDSARTAWRCSSRPWKTSCPPWSSRPAVWAAPPTRCPSRSGPARRQTLGLRWITTYSRKRGENTMKERLAAEIMDAANNTGASVKKREDAHKMAEANKAFAHFRW